MNVGFACELAKQEERDNNGRKVSEGVFVVGFNECRET